MRTENKPRDGCKHMEREQTTIRLPMELKEQLQRKADEDNQSFNTEVIVLLRKGLEAE